MKIRYLLEDSEVDYVEYKLDKPNKRLSNEYVREGVSVTSHSVDISSVLDLEPTKNPQVQLVKKDDVWDFHIFKINAYGKEVRKSLSLSVSKDLKATKIVFINDDAFNHTLTNYITHPVEVYRSPLRIAFLDFSDIKRVTGKSHAAAVSPEITPGAQLMVGAGANMNANIGGAGVVRLNGIPLAISIKVDHLAANDTTGLAQLEINIGANKIEVNTDTGVKYNGAPIFAKDSVGNRADIRLEINQTSAMLHYNELKASIPFNTATAVGEINIAGFCNEGEFTLIDSILVQSLENYRMDAIPPAPVEDIDYITGDTEIFLEWLPNTEEDLAGYNVYVDGRIHNLATIPTPDYQVTGLTNGKTVRIAVTAIDLSGNESPSKEVIETRSISNPIKEISELTYFDNDQGVTFNWTPPYYTDIDKIIVYRLNVATKVQEMIATLDADAVTYQDSPRVDPGEYMYTIATRDTFMNETTGVKVRRHIRALVTTP